MAFKNIKGDVRGSGFFGFNISGKSKQYHSSENAKADQIFSYSVNAYDTSGANPVVTSYPNVVTGNTQKFSTAGYYVLTISPISNPITFDMWAWGGGGRAAGSPGPGGGGAGGGVRGRYTLTAGSSLTFLVSAAAADNGISTFPDGGICNSIYFSGCGGGSSRIGDGVIPFPTRNNAPTQYLLIGGGGGGGSNYLDSGPIDGQGGYPSGQPGGAYYPADGAATIGGGGTQSAGGAGGSAGRVPGGSPGIKYLGGNSGTNGGGAGGGGYYGGGGAGGYYSHGGGGSSYISPLVTNTASFNASPGVSFSGTAVDDPANPGIKPASAGNKSNSGVVIFKVV